MQQISRMKFVNASDYILVTTATEHYFFIIFTNNNH